MATPRQTGPRGGAAATRHQQRLLLEQRSICDGLMQMMLRTIMLWPWTIFQFLRRRRQHSTGTATVAPQEQVAREHGTRLHLTGIRSVMEPGPQWSSIRIC